MLLIIILACLPTLAPQTAEPTQVSDISGSIPRLQAMYIAPSDPFTEVEDFVTVTTAQYNLNLKRYALPMRAALDAYLEDEKSVKAIFMGTRRTDPHSELLSHFSPTDAGWPQFMRVNPMLDWKYVDIWNVSTDRPVAAASPRTVQSNTNICLVYSTYWCPILCAI